MRDPIILKDKKVKIYPLYAQNLQFDYDAILKSRTASLHVNDDDTITMDDPYSARKKVTFEHAWTFDPIVRLAINKKVDFVVGERPITVLDTTKEFTAASEQAAEAFNNVVGNNALQEMKTYIDNLNARLGFHQKLKAAVVNMKIFGRSALHIEKFDNLEPADLKILNSQKLGEVIVNNKTWNLKCVRYSDFPEDDNMLYADELIYFTNVDYNVMPNTLGYGYSEVDPIVHVSECNRIIDMTDLKEINAKLWGGVGLIKFLESKDPAAMRKFLEEFKPGAWTATDANIEIDVKEIKNSLKELIDERNENDLRILRALGVPSFLGGYEKITNRATVRAILEAWKQSHINPERANLKNIIEPQWLDTLSHRYLGERKIMNIAVKVKQEFQDIVFETIKDLSESYLPLFEQGLISGYQLLRLLDLDYLADETKALENKLQNQRRQLRVDLSHRIDQILEENTPKGQMEKSILTKSIKDQLINTIDNNLGNQHDIAIKDFMRNAILKRIAKDKIEQGLNDAGLDE